MTRYHVADYGSHTKQRHRSVVLEFGTSEQISVDHELYFTSGKKQSDLFLTRGGEGDILLFLLFFDFLIRVYTYHEEFRKCLNHLEVF